MQQRKRSGFQYHKILQQESKVGTFWHQIFVTTKKPDIEYLDNGDIPLKYKYLWYMKKTGKDFKAAAIEVVAQELLRLIIPTQTKTRIISSDDGGDTYVVSKQVPGFEGLHQFSADTINAEVKSGHWTGLGECVIGAIWTDNTDLKPEHLGLDHNNRVVCIDGDCCFTSLQKSIKDVRIDYDLSEMNLNQLPYLPDLHAYNWFDVIVRGKVKPKPSMVDHSVRESEQFRRDANHALMKIALLPDALLIKFVHSYLPAEEPIANEIIHEIIRRRDDLLQAAYKNHSFCRYMQSDEAKTDMESYQKYLTGFTTVNKKHLVSAEDDIPEQMNEKFQHIRRKAALQPENVTEQARKKMVAIIHEYIQSMVLYKSNGEKCLSWSASKLHNTQHAKDRINAMHDLIKMIVRRDPPVSFNNCEDMLADMTLAEARMRQESKYGEVFFEAGKYSRAINAVKTLLEADRHSQLLERQENMPRQEAPARRGM